MDAKKQETASADKHLVLKFSGKKSYFLFILSKIYFNSMKDNGFSIDSDGVCLSINASLSTPLTGKLILIFLNLLNAGLLVFAIIEEVVPLALFIAAIFLLLIRYSLWNFYGKEYLTINTKSLRFQYDYGFFRTNPQIKKIGRNLSLQATNVYQMGRKTQLQVIFVCSDENDFPEEIHRMAIPISKKNADELVKLVHMIYIEKITNEYSLPPIYMN